jgi:hypothetical protein
VYGSQSNDGCGIEPQQRQGLSVAGEEKHAYVRDVESLNNELSISGNPIVVGACHKAPSPIATPFGIIPANICAWRFPLNAVENRNS